MPDDAGPTDDPDPTQPPGADRDAAAAVTDGLTHLQNAAHEVLEALKLFGAAAEQAIADPDGAGATIRRFAEAGRAFVDDLGRTGAEPAAADPDDGPQSVPLD